MAKYDFHNLTSARHKLKKYIRKIQKGSDILAHKKELRFLHHLLRQIDRIETHVSRWFKDDVLSRYYEKSKNFPFSAVLPPTTKDFLNEAIATRKPREAYTKDEIEKLVTEIKEVLSKNKSDTYAKLLHKLSEDLSEVSKYHHEAEWYQIDMKRFCYLYDYARILGATVRPSAQVIDPLFGKADGYCAGFTVEWSYLVRDQKNERDHSRLCVSKDVSKAQRKQPHKVLHESAKYIKDYSDIEKLELLQSEVAKLSNEKIYYFRFSKHIIGVRKIPGQALIEIYDPNFGIFIFPNQAAASDWLHCLLQVDFYIEKLEMLGVIEGPNQPTNSMPSIPFNIPASNALPFLQTYLSKNLDTETITKGWMQKALLNAFQNKLDGQEEANEIMGEVLKIKLSRLNISIHSKLKTDHRRLSYTAEDGLKESVISQLQKEIERASSPEVLTELVEKLRILPKYLSLSVLVTDWVRENDDRLEDEDRELLKKFVKHHEVSHYSLEQDRIEVIKLATQELASIKETSKIENFEVTPFIKRLIEIIQAAQNQTLSVGELLLQLQAYSKAEHEKGVSSLFYESMNNEFDLTLAMKIETLNINDPHSLTFLCAELKSLSKNYNEFHQEILKKACDELYFNSDLTEHPNLKSFSELDNLMNSVYSKFETSIKTLSTLYRMFPFSYVTEKTKLYNDSFLDLIKGIASKELCQVASQAKLFKPAASSFYQKIQSATSLKALAEAFEKANMAAHFSRKTFKHDLCNLINCLSKYEDKNPRGYCLVDAFCTRYVLPKRYDIEAKMEQNLREFKKTA